MRKKNTFSVFKREFRVLGVDDGRFLPHTKGDALIVGVVFRGGFSIDGIMSTRISIDGLEATEKIALMVNASPHKRQLRLIMLNGITFAGFNPVDIKRLNFITGLPVISITRNKPNLEAICRALRNLPQKEERWAIILNSQEIFEVVNKGAKVYIGLTGISIDDALKILDLTSTRGSYPEPLRVAHLIASGITF